MAKITQENLLAMELNRSHIGKLVQLITDSWSLTGTLKGVDQHDNREWEIDYSHGRRLVPRAGEIYTVLTIGPWTGRVIGNQPVTVETVRGTIAAPENPLLEIVVEQPEGASRRREALEVVDRGLDALERAANEGVVGEPDKPHGQTWVEPERAMEGNLVDADGDPLFPVHHLESNRKATRCGKGSLSGLALTQTWEQVTCRDCLAFRLHDDLPPEPPVNWSRR